MPDGGDEDHRRIAWVDGDLADVLRFIEADVRPRRAGVGRLVHPITESDRIAERRLAAADVNHVGCRRRDGDGTDRRHRLRIEDRRPDTAGVDRLPDAAVHSAEIELVRPTGYAGRRGDASAAKWAEHAPMKSRIERTGLRGEAGSELLELVSRSRSEDRECTAKLTRAHEKVPARESIRRWGGDRVVVSQNEHSEGGATRELVQLPISVGAVKRGLEPALEERHRPCLGLQVVPSIVASAPENRCQVARSSARCLRPAAVSEYTLALRPFSVAAHAARINPRSSSR